MSWNSVPATSGRSVTPKQAKYSSASKSARPLMLKAPDYAASSGPSKLALHAVSASDEVASIFFLGGGNCARTWYTPLLASFERRG